MLLLAACDNKTKDITSDITTRPDSARIIAKEAWIFGYPIFYNYKSIYSYALDQSSSDYAGGFNRLKNHSEMFTYADTTIVSPNNDTPYTFAMLNLSDEPVVLEVPDIADDRYYVMQLVDLYTFNLAYAGSRTTGNKAGKYMIAGPDWEGYKPPGVDSVFYSETELVVVVGRTELQNEADMPAVKEIQSQYKLTTLHEYTGGPAPEHKQYELPFKPWVQSDYMDISFIGFLNILLQYAPVHPSEKALRESFARIGIVPGRPFDTTAYSKEVIEGIRNGIKDAQEAMRRRAGELTTSMELFGTRMDLKNDYLTRATASSIGIYGNTKEEAVYVGSDSDEDDKPLMGNQKYVLHFTKEQVPPVKYFWSATAYIMPKRHLIKNPIDRYALGDRSEKLKYNKDGSLDIYFQSTSPGKEKEDNWLPTPEQEPFSYVIRLYGPDEVITNGTWQQPLPRKYQ